MRTELLTVVLAGLAATAMAQATTPPRLVSAQLGPAPWNVQSGGIAACEVTLDENGAVVGADLVQDVPPYGAQLNDAVRSWRFEPAREGDRRVGARVLVLGLFRPPTLSIPTPENPLYKTTQAPEEIPWPTYVAVPPYPANVVGSGKVIVETDVSDQGKVASARALGEASVFDSAALDAARQWTFRPASRSGRPIASRAYLVFSFVGVTP
jgi:protein TonB